STLPIVVLSILAIFLGTRQFGYRAVAIVFGCLALIFVWAQAYIDSESRKGLRDDVAYTKITITRLLEATAPGAAAAQRLLKRLALDWSDRAQAFLKEVESRKIRPAFLIATAAQANFSGYLVSDLARCESMRAEAKSLRD